MQESNAPVASLLMIPNREVLLNSQGTRGLAEGSKYTGLWLMVLKSPCKRCGFYLENSDIKGQVNSTKP